ncbi:hypothetical protein, partial [Aeromonas sp. R3-1]|uniref:hypothetical protein n=1 Tax=Aeromonas sp. R3-1 TaxID=3138463 RepID=UPI0034A35BA6
AMPMARQPPPIGCQQKIMPPRGGIKLTTITDLLIDYLSRLIRSHCPSYYACDLSIADATIGLQTGIAKWKTDDHHRRE